MVKIQSIRGKEMKKKLISTIVCAMMVCTSMPAITHASIIDTEAGQVTTVSTVNELLESDLASNMNIELVDEIPSDVQALEFETWEEAYNFINEKHQEVVESNATTNFKTARAFSLPNWTAPTTDKATCRLFYISGTGSKEVTVEFAIPGFSAQTVTTNHYVEYTNQKINNHSRGSYISGIGLCNWAQTYSGLQRENKWAKSIVRGKIGYFISVNGQSIGITETLELQAVCEEK